MSCRRCARPLCPRHSHHVLSRCGTCEADYAHRNTRSQLARTLGRVLIWWYVIIGVAVLVLTYGIQPTASFWQTASPTGLFVAASSLIFAPLVVWTVVISAPRRRFLRETPARRDETR